MCNSGTDCIPFWGTLSYEPVATAGALNVTDVVPWTLGAIALLAIFFMIRFGRLAEAGLIAAVLTGTVVTAAFGYRATDPYSIRDVHVVSALEVPGAVMLRHPVSALYNATGQAIALTRILPNFSRPIEFRSTGKEPDCLALRVLEEGDVCYIGFGLRSTQR